MAWLTSGSLMLLDTLQAYDAMLNEHHPLRSYSMAESDLDIAADPLIFLGCGHVIHMTTMDQYMSLDDVYSRDGQGHWAAPSPLGVRYATSLTSTCLTSTPSGCISDTSATVISTLSSWVMLTVRDRCTWQVCMWARVRQCIVHQWGVGDINYKHQQPSTCSTHEQ